MTSAATLESTLTCPSCGHGSAETMPTDSCQVVWVCAACAAVLRPLPGHCCVFCSYGSVPCPPVQASRPGDLGGRCCS